ncbi:hypothetical protein [Candidatus Protofrankia californiensis]|uniref:hypothetical protein n=1 Tax=Candidatus Protofrankia californiensis TaxID=1839754 RepID=UPI0019D195FE|nr:hypothetical protein [Candidatus Protofrankia californiensis]
MMIKYPAVPRYFLLGADSEVVQILKELNAEQGILHGGAPDALDRFVRLSERLDEASPHYKIDLARSDREYKVTLRPRYRGAELDQPISFVPQLQFGDSEFDKEAALRYQEFVDFGGDVELGESHVRSFTVTAPLGLGGYFTGGSLRFSSNREDLNPALNIKLLLVDGQGRIVSSLPGSLTQRISGQAGGMLFGQDLTGFVRIQIRLDRRTHRWKLNLDYSLPSSALPATVLPVLRFLRKAKTPNYLAFSLDGIQIGEPCALPSREVVSEEAFRTVEQLERIQALTSTSFALPRELTPDDYAALLRCIDLIDRGRINAGRQSMIITLSPHRDIETLNSLDLDRPTAMRLCSPDYYEEIAGNRIYFGEANISLRSALIVNKSEFRSALDGSAAEDVRVEVMPVEGASIEVDLLSPTDIRDDTE